MPIYSSSTATKSPLFFFSTLNRNKTQLIFNNNSNLSLSLSLQLSIRSSLSDSANPPPPQLTSLHLPVAGKFKFLEAESAGSDMVTSVVSPRRSIRDTVFQSVGAYYRNNKRRCMEEQTVELTQIGAERTKNVLILMSDTGGGHRASAEAIRDAFKLEFGDEYTIFVKDVWKEYTGSSL